VEELALVVLETDDPSLTVVPETDATRAEW
jgi:hypothetical protein